MTHKRIARIILSASALAGIVFCAPAVRSNASVVPAGKTRTYYVGRGRSAVGLRPVRPRRSHWAWTSTTSAKPSPQSGPHRIGRVYKKAVYHEYTDATFSTRKQAQPRRAIPGNPGGRSCAGAVGDTIMVVI